MARAKVKGKNPFAPLLETDLFLPIEFDENEHSLLHIQSGSIISPEIGSPLFSSERKFTGKSKLIHGYKGNEFANKLFLSEKKTIDYVEKNIRIAKALGLIS